MVKLEKIMDDEVMHDMVDEQKQGSYSVRRPYMLRSCIEICMLLKNGGENEGKGKEVAVGKGKRVVVDRGRRVVVFMAE